MTIVVLNKETLDCELYSDLKVACDELNLKYCTIVRKDFPINLKNIIIYKRKIKKTKRAKYNLKNLKYGKNI